MSNFSLDDTLNKSVFVTLDSDQLINVHHIADRLKNLGNWPKFYEEDQVRKALDSEGIDLDQLIKAGRNVGNLIPVRRRMVNKQGTAYMKTVYIKKEDPGDPQKSARFLEQNELEQSLAVGDRVNVNFKGWNSGTKYSTDKVRVKKIESDKITVEFIEEFQTNNSRNYKYSVGDEVVIPKSESSAWNKDMSISRYVEPTPEPVVEQSVASEIVESIDQISVGDKVMVKQRGDADDVEGEIKYIHPRGDFIDIQVGDKVKRRKLGRFSLVQETPAIQGLNSERVARLREMGMSISGPGSAMISREDRSRVVGQEEYQQRTRIDRFGVPNSRGRSWGNVTKVRNKFYQRTDEEMEQLRQEADRNQFKQFNEKFGNFDFETYIQETRSVIREADPTVSTNAIGFTVSVAASGNFALRVGGPGLSMTRRFDADKMSVDHSYFTLASTDQGKGVGKKLFKALYKQYKRIGLKSVTCHANIDVGGYAWGRYGFDAPRDTAERFVRAYQTNIGRSRGGYVVTQQDADKAKQAYNEFYQRNDAQTRFPMNLLSCIGPDSKAGKAILLGADWRGRLNLENTTQRVHFENYIGFSE
jgi:GNAT superfamily N-acetyltransferase